MVLSPFCSSVQDIHTISSGAIVIPLRLSNIFLHAYFEVFVRPKLLLNSSWESVTVKTEAVQGSAITKTFHWDIADHVLREAKMADFW